MTVTVSTNHSMAKTVVEPAGIFRRRAGHRSEDVGLSGEVIASRPNRGAAMNC